HPSESWDPVPLQVTEDAGLTSFAVVELFSFRWNDGQKTYFRPFLTREPLAGHAPQRSIETFIDSHLDHRSPCQCVRFGVHHERFVLPAPHHVTHVVMPVLRLVPARGTAFAWSERERRSRPARVGHRDAAHNAVPVDVENAAIQAKIRDAGFLLRLAQGDPRKIGIAI